MTSRLSFFLVNEISEKLNTSEVLAQRLEYRIKKAYREGFDNYHYIARDVVEELNSARNDYPIEKEIGYDPDDLKKFVDKLSTIIHSWENCSGDPDIKFYRNVLKMTQQQFADALNVSKRTVEKWEQKERSPNAQIYKHIRVMVWFKYRNQLHEYLSI
ncbi:helix-turn-helix domain-containing protein [Endozoicomonas sp. ALC066]|uniref:helix-turn-helix domain-containing protein n=1 Tax=Endozoicomonas sp. ALC066 TaxID=3403078 RepID=UPI003BB7B3F9